MAAGDLYRWLVTTASERPRSPALTFLAGAAGDETTYTFYALFERATELGERLAEVHNDLTSPVGLLLSSQEDQVLHYLAALSIGAAPAILTPPNPKLNRDYYIETTNEVLRRCQFGAVVSDIEGIDIPTQPLQPFTLAPQVGGRSASTSGLAGTEDLQVPFIQFSSGTTGIKRGVMVSDDAVISQLREYGDALGLGDDDCIVSWLPLYHDMGFIACLNMPLAYGVHSVMIDPIDWVSKPARFLQAVSRFRGTLSWHPNFAFAFMATNVRDKDLEDVDLSSLRGLVNCSEPATQKSQETFLDRFESHGLSRDVFKGCYAMAETTFALTHGEPDDEGYLDPQGPADDTNLPRPVLSVGRPLPGVELKIMSTEAPDELPDREVGEIWVRSPFNFLGYYNDDEATRDAIVDGWYRTGDLGYRVDGAYYVVGRLKDLLIVAGVNVFPQDIEDLVSKVDGVHPGRVSAFSSFDERVQTERITVLAESDQHDGPDAVSIVQDIRQRILSAFQVANIEVSLVSRGWLVKSTSGKMARSANKAKWSQGTKANRPD